MKHRTTLALALSIGFGCAGTSDAVPEVDLSAEALANHIQTLSSDEFEGRGPSSPGEEKTVPYLIDHLRNVGVGPGNGSSYTQDVPLVALQVTGTPALQVNGNGQNTTLNFGTETVMWTKRVVDAEQLSNSEMVFVGYGTVAPEYGWNDYDGVDVAGKTVVMLVNDPGFATKDPEVFNGNSMTYYGRWTYKFEEAARQGAAGAIVIHMTEPAGYPWDVVQSSWTGPQFNLVAADNNMSRVAVEGWITSDAANRVFTQAGLDLAALSERAAQPGFEAVPMGLSATTSLTNGMSRSASANVIGMVPGTETPDEYVVYMAHWDHLGRDPTLEGDQIYNGALDNATGTSGLLLLAEAFAQHPAKRSVVFLAVTAEEQGLLGSAYYGSNPVFPPNRTIAAINMDGLNIDGPMNDITVVGYGNSELDGILERMAASQGRSVRADPEPEKGFYYRSDHFSFAKVGIPSLYTDAGIDHVEHGSEWTLARRAEYTANNYHKPSDEYSPSWDLSGAIQDLQLLYGVGWEIANSGGYPNWNEGNEFRAQRDQDLAARGIQP